MIGYLSWYRRLWQRRLVRATDLLAREFAVETARWGGPLALRDRAVLESVLTKVVSEDFVVSDPPA